MFKRLVKTKTFWTGIVAIAAGVGIITKGEVSAGVETILGGIGMIFIRDAVSKGKQ